MKLPESRHDVLLLQFGHVVFWPALAFPLLVLLLIVSAKEDDVFSCRHLIVPSILVENSRVDVLPKGQSCGIGLDSAANTVDVVVLMLGIVGCKTRKHVFALFEVNTVFLNYFADHARIADCLAKKDV